MSSMQSQGLFSQVRIGWLSAAAVAAYVLLFNAQPYANVGVMSFWEKDLYSIRPAFSFANYERIFVRSVYSQVVSNSLATAAYVTLTSSVLGYVLAYFMATYARRWQFLLLALLMIPLWTSFLLRAYIWKIILGRNGILNTAMMDAGVIEQPLSFLLYNQFSICLALTYIFLPFVALPVYAALERIPREYVEASGDLGAPPGATFFHVVFPLSIPSLLSGATIVFCLSFGDFITPALLGGSDDIMIANVIISQFGAAFDWPFGSALAISVLCVVVALVTFSQRLGNLASGSRSGQ